MTVPTEQVAPAAIEARNLCKYYDEFRAIENISFKVQTGTVCAFLGPNGAGKST
ncbi:MAG: ATP-binding cassette domain-containing protein, partial [Planctomycetes bacterium]|nr:ATP-binding cassette domain-containing protein [Planctomycetota bacterium]